MVGGLHGLSAGAHADGVHPCRDAPAVTGRSRVCPCTLLFYQLQLSHGACVWFCFRSTPEPPKIPVKGRRTNLDFQQYIYISQVCYHEALPWYSRFLPYVTLLHTLVLLASGCFWFHFPLTSARIEHFLSLLAKCCESPWTTRALSLTAKLDTRFSETEQAVQAKVQVTSSYKMRKSSLDSGTDSPLLAGTDSVSTTMQPSPCPSTLSHCSTLSAMSLTEPVMPVQVVPDTSRQGATLDRSDREQARALFERVRRFRAHCESSDVIYKVKPKVYLHLVEQLISTNPS